MLTGKDKMMLGDEPAICLSVLEMHAQSQVVDLGAMVYEGPDNGEAMDTKLSLFRAFNVVIAHIKEEHAL